jgi:hypothetical protein
MAAITTNSKKQIYYFNRFWDPSILLDWTGYIGGEDIAAAAPTELLLLTAISTGQIDVKAVSTARLEPIAESTGRLDLED